MELRRGSVEFRRASVEFREFRRASVELRRASTVGESVSVAAVTLSQMVDMAYNPEVGVVRFNVLQSLLHAVLRTLGIGDVEAHYDVTPTTTAELTDTTPTSPEDDIVAPLGSVLHQKSSVGLPVLHIVMPAPAMCELVPSPSTPFHEVADKVKKMEVRLERLYRAPSNEELLSDISVNRVGDGAVANMWQNLQMLRKVEAQADGMKELMTLVSNLFEENRKQLEETHSMKHQVENISRIINTEMEVPSFVTWSSLEEILKGVQSPEVASGPSTALKDHMKTIGKIDKDVVVLDEKCQVLDGKVQEHGVTLKRLDPDVGNLMSTMRATSGEISNFLKLRKSHNSDMEIETDVESTDDVNGFDNLAGNVRQLVSETDENLNKIHKHLNFSGASVEKRLLALEEAVAELRDTLKMEGFGLNLSASDIELSHSQRHLEGLSPIYDPDRRASLRRASDVGKINYDPVDRRSSLTRGSDVGKVAYDPVDRRSSLSRSSDGGYVDVANQAMTTSSRSEGHDVGKPSKPSLLTVLPSPPVRKNATGDIQEVNAKLTQLGRKLKLQLKQSKVKIDELESKLREIGEHVNKLRTTMSCDEAVENSCLRVLQRSVDQLQTDIRKVTELGLEAKALTEKVQRFEDSQVNMVSSLSDAGGKFSQLASRIADLERKMQAEEEVWNQFIGSVTDKLDESTRRVHLEMVSVRKDVQCHLHKLNDDVGQLHHFLDEFGDSGAGLRRKLKFQCLSCDRKLLVTSLEPPGDSCPAQAGFQSSISAHPYTSFEMENIRNRQKTCLLPKQLTNFQRAILERHMARLRMRDFRAYFMQCWNDLPEVKTAKSYKCSTLYEKEANLPDIYSRLSRNSGGPLHVPLPPSSGQINPNYGNRKGVEFVDALNLTQTTSANTVGNKSSDLASSKPTANTSFTKKPRNSQMPFHARRNLSHGKRLTKCPELLISDDPQDATSGEHSVADEPMHQSTSVHMLHGMVASPTSSDN